MVTVRALDHIVLIVADVERSLAWYVKQAGLTSVNVDAWRDGKAFFPSLRVDAGTIIDFVDGEPGDGRGHLEHICFVVSEADLASLVSDASLDIVDQGERSGARGVGQSVYVRDPDDLLIEFRCYPNDDE
jgi:catechol 2,3-dioxygenase-like lactoylglutathione lyase family enzyme